MYLKSLLMIHARLMNEFRKLNLILRLVLTFPFCSNGLIDAKAKSVRVDPNLS